MSGTQGGRRTPAGAVGDVLLWIAAAGGAICIAAVVAAAIFHVTLIMFKTGSMQPTIPTGSLAVVHEIPASEVRVGDIVTVDRPGLLPVTHRVTAISGAGDRRALTLKGDANPVDDPAPYDVDTVRIVWAWVPGWAGVVVWFSNPLVLGALTVGTAGLVTWAFWPRDAGHGRRRSGRAPMAGTVAVALMAAVASGLAGFAATRAEPTRAAWTSARDVDATVTAATPAAVPVVTCGAASGGILSSIPIAFTPPPGPAPSRYRIQWAGSAGSGTAYTTTSPGAVNASGISVAGTSVVTVYPEYGDWVTSPASLQTVKFTTVAVVVVVSWTCTPNP
jgi:signal peptidase